MVDSLRLMVRIGVVFADSSVVSFSGFVSTLLLHSKISKFHLY